MALAYTKIKNCPKVFRNLFGIDVSLFDSIIIKLRPLWKKNITDTYKRPGRDYKYELEDYFLMLLMYYRNYVTYRFLAFIFDIDASRICRIVKTLEPLLVQITALKKERHLSEQETQNLINFIIIDATEQAIERPKNPEIQEIYYSGKKKQHTFKTEIRTTLQGEIVYVSPSCEGSIHDFKLYKSGPSIDPNVHIFADSGYQGIDKIHEGSVDIPYKKQKNKILDEESKEYNRALSKIRVKVEHVIGHMKIFRILSYRYRNKRKRYEQKVNIIAGLTNMNHGFMVA